MLQLTLKLNTLPLTVNYILSHMTEISGTATTSVNGIETHEQTLYHVAKVTQNQPNIH